MHEFFGKQKLGRPVDDVRTGVMSAPRIFATVLKRAKSWMFIFPKNGAEREGDNSVLLWWFVA
jgi:hypothetical protein